MHTHVGSYSIGCTPHVGSYSTVRTHMGVLQHLHARPKASQHACSPEGPTAQVHAHKGGLTAPSVTTKLGAKKGGPMQPTLLRTT